MIVPIYRDALSARHRLRRRPSLLFASRQWRRDAGSVAASDIDEISSTPTSCPMRPISLFLVLPLPSPFFLLFIFYISYFFYLNKMMRGAIRREKAIGKIFCFHGLICRLNEHWWLFFFAPVAIIDVVRSFSGQAEETIRIAAKIMRFIPPPLLVPRRPRVHPSSSPSPFLLLRSILSSVFVSLPSSSSSDETGCLFFPFASTESLSLSLSISRLSL